MKARAKTVRKLKFKPAQADEHQPDNGKSLIQNHAHKYCLRNLGLDTPPRESSKSAERVWLENYGLHAIRGLA